MEGKDRPLLRVIKDAAHMIIPVYQRNYDWKIEQCRQLLDDLIDVMQDKHEHFFGSVVSVEIDRNGSRLIIDGQQRIVTVSLMLLALVDLICGENELLQCNDKSRFVDNALHEYLKSRYDGEKKLQLIKNDQLAFEKLFEPVSKHIEESNITRNYNFFFNSFRQLKSADAIFEAINMLSIIDIILDSRSDNPQKIFESLNSTGLDLNEGDKIRNFILMNMPPDKQEQFYNDYWHKIEELTKPADGSLSYNVSGFVRDYLTVKTNKIPRQDAVYVEFKSYASKSRLDSQEFLSDMLKYARYYNAINTARTSSKRANDILTRFNLLQVKVSMPYFLALCNFRAEQKISEDDFVEVFRIIDSYAFRRLMCDVPSNSYNKIFPTLHYNALTKNTGYVDALKYALTIRSGEFRCPNDEEFATQILEKDIRSLIPRGRIYFFARLESGISPNGLDILSGLLDKTYVIDWIMPKKLTIGWKRELGARAEEIHETWVNRSANLTVLDAGVRRSSLSFKEKKFMQNGFHYSSLQLNRAIDQYQNWTERELFHRSNVLKQLALKLWAYPQSSFKPSIREKDLHSLAEDFDFTGRTVLGYTFDGKRYNVKDWKDMYTQVLKLVFSINSSQMYQFAKQNSTFASTAFVNGFQIGNRLYSHANTDTNKKMRILRELFDLCGLDKDELEIELRPAVN